MCFRLSVNAALHCTALQRNFAFGISYTLGSGLDTVSTYRELMEVINLIVPWMLTIKIDCWQWRLCI
jgi:hypothetical protein